jgi:hypothetical protein
VEAQQFRESPESGRNGANKLFPYFRHDGGRSARAARGGRSTRRAKNGSPSAVKMGAGWK